MSRLLSAVRLRRSASFRRLTGVSAATFEQMLKQLRAPWTEMQRSKRKSGRPWEIGGLEAQASPHFAASDLTQGSNPRG